MEASRKSGARFLYEATVRDPSSLWSLRGIFGEKVADTLAPRSVPGSPLWARFRRCSERATRLTPPGPRLEGNLHVSTVPCRVFVAIAALRMFFDIMPVTSHVAKVCVIRCTGLSMSSFRKWHSLILDSALGPAIAWSPFESCCMLADDPMPCVLFRFVSSLI